MCTKRNKPQVNAIVLNDLDRELSDEVLNNLAKEDILTEDFGELSIHAISGADDLKCIQLKARVQDKTMIILLDSGSTHNFISSRFVQVAHLPTIPIPSKKVQVASGEWMLTTRKVPQLQWYCQGYTLMTDMIVLDMHTYDAILGYEWLKSHSPMNCDWDKKILEFREGAQMVKLQGLQQLPKQVIPMSASNFHKAAQGNDLWAVAIVDCIPETSTQQSCSPANESDKLQLLLAQYKDVFTDPKVLPPPRTQDHTIPLMPNAIPVNSKPYHYSPLHKDEIERQVQELLQAGLITHSTSPFASPVLLVKKKMAPGDSV